MVSFRHSEENFAAANEPKLFGELRGGHNEMLSDREQFFIGIERFLRIVERVRGTAGACPSSGTASEGYRQG